jgi:hypothetical protein
VEQAAGNRKFSTAQEWEKWWEDAGERYARRAAQSFTELAEARVGAGLSPEGELLEADDPDS